MNILVTGALGTIGIPLVKALANRGHTVFGCDLAHHETERGFSLHDNPERHYFRCDVSEYRQLDTLMSWCQPDLVYHAAAEFGRWNGEDYYENLWRTNVIGTKHLLRLSGLFGFKLVHFSSSEVYGDWHETMREDVPNIVAIRQMNDYAMTKMVNEQQIRNSDVEAVIVRLFNTYGPGEYYSPYRSVNCRFIYCALKGIPWKVFKGHKRTSTYIDDTIQTLANIPDNFKPGEVYNIGGDTEHTIEELSQAVIKATGADPLLAMPMESEPMTTKRKQVDCSKAIRDLAHKITVQLDEGIGRTAAWMQTVI